MSVMGRIFAALYERMMKDTEEAGLRDHRRAIVGRARGRVLEIGAGTGLNLDHYGPEVTELVLTEPEEPMARRLRARLTKGEVIGAGADDLPFPDGSFDTVVSTLVLCTVPDQQVALGELRRVLKPGGPLLLTTPDHPRALLVRFALRPASFEEHFSPYADHLRFFTARTLRRVLDDAGFEASALTRAEGHLLACAF